MKIVILGSINATPKIKKVSDELKNLGFEVEIPWMSQKIIEGKQNLDDFLREKEANGDNSFREQAEEDLIKRHYKKIQNSDIALVVNIDKNGTKNYIGGNVLIEMGFAHILDKKIFLLNEIPELSYTDEIKAMMPIILNGDLKTIKDHS